MNLSKREKLIFVATAAVIICALVYNFLIVPFIGRWNESNSEIIRKEIALKKGLKLIENKNDIIRDYNSFAKSTRNLSKILGYIEKHALSSGVKTANIKPKPLIQNSYYKEYIIEIQIEGTFSSINKLVSELIKPPLYIKVNKFDLRTVRDGSSLKGTMVLSKLLI